MNLERSISKLLTTKVSNFDSLIKNIANNTDLYSLVFQLLIEGEQISFGVYAPAMEKAILYGIIAQDENKRIKIHNPIYELLIYHYLIDRIKIEEPQLLPVKHIAERHRNRLHIIDLNI